MSRSGVRLGKYSGQASNFAQVLGGRMVEVAYSLTFFFGP